MSVFPLRGRALKHRFHVAPLAFSALASIVAGCKPNTVSLEPTALSLAPRDYFDIYKKWTREKKSFSFGRLANVLAVTATFESWEFRWAYVVRYAEDYALEVAERDALLRETLADSRANHRFFVTLAGEKYPESDITALDTAWRVTLLTDDTTSVDPLEILRVKKAGMVERLYFPSTSPFRFMFRLRFSAYDSAGSGPTIGPDTRRVTLRFASPAGVVDLDWELRPRRSGLPSEQEAALASVPKL